MKSGGWSDDCAADRLVFYACTIVGQCASPARRVAASPIEIVHGARLTSLKGEFGEEWPTYLTLDATDSLCRAAGALAERYGLPGFDSLHLATFGEISRRAGTGDTRFSSFDERLTKAAQKMMRE